tara:strand:- start:25 stop:1059 length:1035 start_codon:yes stop_codon:yes gene_type:complete
MVWPVRAAQSLWNLGKRPFAGTGWRGGAKGIPAVEAQAAKAGQWRLPPGGRFNRDAQKIPYGARPAVPGSPAVPAGIARRRPIATAAVLGGAGLVGSSLLPDGTPDPTYEPRGGGGLGGVPPIGLPPASDTFQSQLPGLVQRRQEERNSFLDNMQTVMSHSILLSFQNPGRESKYVENAIALLKGDAKSKGAIEDAKIIEEVFKDNKVPKSAKVIYNRLVKHIGPKKASEVSGYTLEIDKAEAKAASDYITAQSKLQDKIGPKSTRLNQIVSMAAMDFDAAVKMLAQEWAGGGTLDVAEIYAGYEGGKTMEEMLQLASNYLAGVTGGGSAGTPANAEVMDIQVQ